ncbi:MAG: pyridoxal phosphate-dependent aminotransferase [Deltaproteobacteria bacterium]|nr:pyridoxal phosphate-dependent aminotransferase [Deltaproteobacteria bacterium]
MKSFIERGSLVRRMFEEAIKLKAMHGADAVFDFSLGNPDVRPPAAFKKAVLDMMNDDSTSLHGYMPNAGFVDVREKVAQYLNKTLCKNLSKPVGPEHLIMTVGAAGGINSFLKAILDPGDNVMVLAPFFMEYVFYAENHAAKVNIAQTDRNFKPDLDSIADKLNDRTRAVIVNSPNNPTGVIYTKEDLDGLGKVLEAKSKQFGRPIFLISDEPYRKIVFGGAVVPSVFESYTYSVLVNSFSKDVSIAGERIGYVCVSPEIPNSEDLMQAAILANRILGFVSAPALMQRVVPYLLEESVDVSIYERRMNILIKALSEIGYDLVKPQGTFYLFPKSPIPDDLAFIKLLTNELILAVPGSGFARPGYFRLSICMDEKKVARSVDGFEKALKKAKSLV